MTPALRGERLINLRAPREADRDPKLSLVGYGTDAADATHVAARIYAASDGGPIRTVVGDGHRHFTGEEPSQKTGLSNPYEGPTEHALIIESELRADVLDYRTQAFRLRLLVGASVQEWIVDHLRHIRCDGVDIIEAIECKPNLSFLSDSERAKQAAAAKIIRGLGWRHRVVYLREVLGSGERQINFGEIYAHQTTHISAASQAVFERMCTGCPSMTFRELREALHPERVQGTAMAHALICRGRIEFDLDRYLFDPTPVRLIPVINFKSRIRF
jgi:hypothetical protein